MEQRFGQGNRKTEHSFARVPETVKPRSSFDRSCGNKGTFQSDLLVPFFLDEILPGDTVNLNTTILARLATQLVPIMDNLYLDTFFFFVPYRLLWTNWQKFNGEQANPGDSIDFTIPKTRYIAAGGVVVGELGDYFGLPTGIAANVRNIDVCAFPFRAYNLIWREHFRDENLQNSPTVDTGNGPDTLANYVLKKRGKRFDYFTGCLPFLQKGVAANIPLGTTAPVLGIGKINTTVFDTAGQTVREADGTTQVYAQSSLISTGGANNSWFVEEGGIRFGTADFPGVYTDLSSAAAATINSLRLAYNVQRVLERDARGGTRYTEMIKSHFGVTSPDARLQRPEFLGGSSTPINIAPIAATATAETSGTPPITNVGYLGAYGVVHSGRNGFVKSFTEHGLIMGLMSVRADITYQQGLHRMWSRSTRYDFYLPTLANLGEQAVLNKEIYFQNDSGAAIDNATFGYQERFAEYRYKPSQIVGQLRSTFATSLDFWHMAEEFTALPTLGDTFIQSSTPIERSVAITTDPDFVFDSWTKMKHVRVMPVFSIPGWDNKF